MDDDARRWDERYASTSATQAQAPEMIERWPASMSLIPTDGRCLDVASGPGSVTLWLAGRGLQVTALDVSPRAIDLLRQAANASGLGALVDARVVDLDDGLPADLRDLDLIVCQRFRDPALYSDLVERLGHGGAALVTVLSEVGSEQPGPFHAPPGELRAGFAGPGCDIVLDVEGDGLAHLAIRRT